MQIKTAIGLIILTALLTVGVTLHFGPREKLPQQCLWGALAPEGRWFTIPYRDLGPTPDGWLSFYLCGGNLKYYGLEMPRGATLSNPEALGRLD